MINATCSNEEKVPVVASPVTSSGRPAAFDKALRITVQSGDGTVEQDAAKPNEFFAVSGDAPGDTVYLIEADVDLGEGETLIQDTLTLTVSGANATAFGLVPGSPVPK